MEGSEVKPVREGEEFTSTDAGFEVCPREDGDHGWRLRAGNGQIIATSGEGFESKAGAIRAVGTVKRTVGEVLAYDAEVRAIEDADEAEQVAADEAKTG